MNQDQSAPVKKSKVFSAGPEILNQPFADMLKDFKVGAQSSTKPRRSRKAKRKTSVVAQHREVTHVQVSPAVSESSDLLNDVAPTPAAKDLPAVSSHANISDEHQYGNVSVGQLFLNHKNLSSLLNGIYERKEKAICTFFQLGARGDKEGKRVKSFLSLRIVPRAGGRIALCVVPGGTKWLAERFPVGLEFYHDELLLHREAPEERKAATRVLRLIIDAVRTARHEARKAKDASVKQGHVE